MSARLLICPVCKGPTQISSTELPFCCIRCKLQDLSKWFSEEYRVPTPISHEGDQDFTVLSDLAPSEDGE